MSRSCTARRNSRASKRQPTDGSARRCRFKALRSRRLRARLPYTLNWRTSCHREGVELLTRTIVAGNRATGGPACECSRDETAAILRRAGNRRGKLRTKDAHSLHGYLWYRTSDRARRHAARWHRGTRVRRGQRRCPRLPHRLDPAFPGSADGGNCPYAGADRQALRRELDDSADVEARALSGVRAGHHRVRYQDCRDRRQQPAALSPRLPGRRHQGHPQVHVGSPRGQGGVDRV